MLEIDRFATDVYTLSYKEGSYNICPDKISDPSETREEKNGI